MFLLEKGFQSIEFPK